MVLRTGFIYDTSIPPTGTVKFPAGAYEFLGELAAFRAGLVGGLLGWNAVVEHKAQTHLRGFALISRFCSSGLSCRTDVLLSRQCAVTMKTASQGGKGSERLIPWRRGVDEALSGFIVFSRVFSLKVVASRAFFALTRRTLRSSIRKGSPLRSARCGGASRPWTDASAAGVLQL